MGEAPVVHSGQIYHGDAATASNGPQARAWMCFLLLCAAWYAVVGARAGLSQWTLHADDCAPMAEALAWHAGRTDLPHELRDTFTSRMHDTAWVAATGRVYNICPPLMTLICYSAAWLDVGVLRLPEPTRVVGPLIFATVVIVPLLLSAFWAMRVATGSREWGGFLAFALLAATANYPLTEWSRGGNAGYVNHLLSQTGLLLIAGDLLGRRRMWPAALGLVIASWSRQLTLFYAIPMLALAWTGPRRGRDTWVVLTGAVVALGGLMALSWVRFGSPFETGYLLIYEGRGDDDVLAFRARQGLFALRWLPENLAYLVWRLPEVDFSQQGLSIAGHVNGNSLLFSTPLVLVVAASARSWWSDRKRRWLVIGTLPVIAGVLLYHAPGFISTGCYRFGMDFVPIWIAVAGAALVSPRWRWWCMGCVAWSVVYFQLAR